MGINKNKKESDIKFEIQRNFLLSTYFQKLFQDIKRFSMEFLKLFIKHYMSFYVLCISRYLIKYFHMMYSCSMCNLVKGKINLFVFLKVYRLQVYIFLFFRTRLRQSKILYLMKRVLQHSILVIITNIRMYSFSNTNNLFTYFR